MVNNGRCVCGVYLSSHWVFCPICGTAATEKYGTQPTDVQHTQAKMPSWGDVTKGITFSTVGERDVAAEVFSRIARHFGCA